jgi:hypothetical protein
MNLLKKVVFLLILLSSLYSFSLKSNLKGVNNIPLSGVDSFYSTTRNNSWAITRLFLSAQQTDKANLLSSVTLSFNQADTSKFLLESTGISSRIGQWTPQNQTTILLSLPQIINDSSIVSSTDSLYNEGSKILSAWPLKITKVEPTKVKFKMNDPVKGEVLIELTKK